jgi:hypothetical protein
MLKQPRFGRRISKKSVQTLLQDSQWTVDPELSSHPNLLYRHPDGRILHYFFPTDGRLVEPDQSQSYVEFLQIMKTVIPENPYAGHVLVGLLPQGENFIQQIPALIAELPEILKLFPDDLDFSPESLAKIDPKLKRLTKKKVVAPPVFPALVAYMGEMFRRRYKAE